TGFGVNPALHARGRTDRFLAAVSGIAPCKGTDDACTLELATSAVLAHSAILDPSSELALETTRVDSTGRRLGGRAGARFRTGEMTAGASLTAGAEDLRV